MVLSVERPFGALMNPLTEHLREVGETYPQHLVKAAGFGITMLVAGVACLVHALFPFLFVRTGSSCIHRLHEELEDRRVAIVDRDGQSVPFRLQHGREQLES